MSSRRWNEQTRSQVYRNVKRVCRKCMGTKEMREVKPPEPVFGKKASPVFVYVPCDACDATGNAPDPSAEI